METKTLPLSEIQPDPENPRIKLNEEGIQSLAQSIQANGMNNPIIVTPDHVIIAGHRRHAAWQVIDPSMSTPVEVRVYDGDEQGRRVVQAIDNLQREDLNPIEVGRQFKLLSEYLTQQQIAERVGVTQSHISKRIRLLNLPQQVQDLLVQGKLGITEAEEISSVADILSAEDMVSLADSTPSVVRQKVEAAQAEQRVSRVMSWAQEAGFKTFDRITAIEKEDWKVEVVGEGDDAKPKQIKPQTDHANTVVVTKKGEVPSPGAAPWESGQVVVRRHKDGGAQITPVAYHDVEKVEKEENLSEFEKSKRLQAQARSAMQAHLTEVKLPRKGDINDVLPEYVFSTASVTVKSLAARVLGLDPVEREEGPKDYVAPLRDKFNESDAEAYKVMAYIILCDYINNWPHSNRSAHPLLEAMGFDFGPYIEVDDEAEF